MVKLQKTIKKSVEVQGIGLHSGKPASLTIHPAAASTGIIFRRTDIAGAPEIRGHFSHVVKTQLATTLGNDNANLSTVEHVLAAVRGAGIDNAIIDVNGPEAPIMDGSAAPFYRAIVETGVESQLKARSYIQVRRKIDLKLDGKWAFVEPHGGLEIHATVEWDHPWIGYQEFRYVEGQTPFSQIADARTFGMLRDVEYMKSLGLIKGGSLENAVVLNDEVVLNPEGLRYSDEFVRHKVLDAVGDFALAGMPLLGRFRLHRAGHDVHRQLLATIFEDRRNYEIVVPEGQIWIPSRQEEAEIAEGLEIAAATV